MRYEDLLDHGDREVRRLYDFVGLAHDDAQIAAVVAATSFANMQRPGNDHHIRAGGTGGWRSHFSAADEELVVREAADMLTELGYAV